MSRRALPAALLILAALAFACEDEDGSCYAVDLTEEACLARGRCRHKLARFVFTDDRDCFLGEATNWLPGRDLGIGVCVAWVDDSPNPYGESYSQRLVCKKIAPNLHIYMGLFEKESLSSLPDDWDICYYEEGWTISSINDGYFSEYCTLSCGDGILDPGESCEPSQSIMYETCEDAGDQLERDWLSGTPVCANCVLQLYDCEAAP